ncbi:hypothetical protein G7Y89_g2817 [Cudoniella acicularis]|uniref:Uncharacterized protein n=1 Tax=Cudoniella acicularis TaxID=354080 RepID=A0A8H4W8A2_9HELO|nr:hypothetical protein G7Y89_g2817 [Cudoniella acicularis]
MLRSSIIRPLVKGWTALPIRCFPRHHFAPPTLLPSLLVRLSPTKVLCLDIQARGVHKKAGSEEAQGKQPSDSPTDDHNKDGGSSSPSALYFLALFFFILGARRRREGRQDESPIDTNGEVDLKGTSD